MDLNHTSSLTGLVFYVLGGSLPLTAGFLPVGLANASRTCRRGSWPGIFYQDNSLIQFSVHHWPCGLVRYRGHAPRADYLALKVS